LQHFAGIGQAGLQLLQGTDDLIQPGTFASQRLGAFRVFPDFWIFQLTINLFQAVTFGSVVKDTP
jgi:hypothetical protein